MPGAQDRWDQITEPGAGSQQATPPDLPQTPDRPERRSLADLRQRLERLPVGHPSSPYNDDLTRKPPVASLKHLELPLHGAEHGPGEHGPNGAATRYEPESAGDPAAAPRTQAAGRGGSAGGKPAADGTVAEDRSDAADAENAPDIPGPAEDPGAEDGYGTPDGSGRVNGSGGSADWFSTSTWGRTDSEWKGPEPTVETASHVIADTQRDHADDRARAGPDGSWDWSGRHLTPDECMVAEAALGRCRIAEGRNVFGGYGHSGLTPAMRRIEAQLQRGQLLPDTETNALKSADGFKKRFADLILRHPDKSAEELSHEVHDAIRYAFILDTEDYAEGTLQVHSRLKGHGFELEARWNGWESHEYKGINTRWRDPAHDQVFEVQFHTASSWDVWHRAHASYQQITDPATAPAQRALLREIHAENSGAIPVPPRCTAIPDFRKEGQ